MAIEFLAELTDRMSEPASKMTEGMKGLTSSLLGAKEGVSGLQALGTGIDKLMGNFQQGRNELGQFTAATGPMTEGLGAIAGPAGIAAAVIAALTLAVAALVAEGMKMALEASEMREQLVQTFDGLSGVQGQGEKTIAMLDDLRATTGQTRAQLGEWAQTMMAAGTRDLPTLQARLTAVSSAFALMGTQGKQAADKVTALFAKLDESAQTGKKLQVTAQMLKGIGVDAADIAAKMNIPVSKLNADLKAGTANAKELSDAITQALTEKGKGALERFSNSMTSMGAQFKENLSLMFEGVDVSGFVSGLKDVAKVFDQSTASGKAMKFLITQAFNGIFAVAQKVFPYVKSFLLGLVAAALRIYIALKPAIKAISQLFAGPADKGVLDFMFSMGETIGIIIAGFIKAIIWVTELVAAIGSGFGSAIKAISGAASAVGDFIQGLIDGISNGVGMVVDAIKAMGKSMLTGLKSALGISSPSKEMMKLGMHSATGFTQGIQAGNDNAGVAGGALASSLAGGAVAGGKGGGGGRGGVVVNIGKIEIHGVQGAEAMSSKLKEELSTVFEELALENGLGVGTSAA